MRDVSIRKVLVTADTVGGVFTYSLTLAKALAVHGVEVHLATMGDLLRPEQRAAAEAIPGLVVHESTFELEWMDDPWDDVRRSCDWLLALEDVLRPDVVHLNGYAHGALPFRAPKVVVAHSCVLSWWEAVLGEAAPARYDSYRRAVASGLAGADVVVAISAAMRDCLVRHYGHGANAIVIHNGAPEVPRPDMAEKAPFILSAGRVWDRAKNVETLARAAPRLPWPVKVAGWDAGTYPNVEALGWLGPGRLDEVMRRASIFALPARYEPFGLSPLEAALRGCALVLGDIPSLREVWGDAALYVPPDDEHALAAALSELAAGDGRRLELARHARARALTYPAARTARSMLSLYSSLAERKELLSCA